MFYKNNLQKTKKNSSNTYILGIFCYFRDSSACLLRNGNIVAMAEEERFTREKHSSDFPENAIKFCLDKAKIKMSDVACVAYGFRPWQFLAYQSYMFMKNFPKSLNLLNKGSSHVPFPDKIINLATIRQRICKAFDVPSVNLIYVNHHLAHAYASYYTSRFGEAAILITDGFGEISSTSFYHGKNGKIQNIGKINYPNSIGVYYGGLTEFLGFRPENDEYKVMGMCAYGQDKYREFFKKVLSANGYLGYKLDASYFDLMTHGVRKWISSKFEKELGKKRNYNDAYEQFHFDVACSAQSRLEEVMQYLGKALQSKTKSRNICIGGGVAQNVLMNRAILDGCGFEDVSIPPVAYDGGISLGSALAVHHQYFNGKKEFALESPSWGPDFSDDECMRAIKKRGLSFELSQDLSSRIADLLAEGKITGYFSGRMEIGPRALGNRSILADPRRKETKDILNLRIKKREYFRPFAASVTIDDAKSFFDLPVESPFMTLSSKVKTPDILQAVTHKDGTSRIQTVKQNISPDFYKLLKEFQKRTNVPVLLNTSFNENEPIVCTPQEATDCFLRTQMDALVFNNKILVSR